MSTTIADLIRDFANRVRVEDEVEDFEEDEALPIITSGAGMADTITMGISIMVVDAAAVTTVLDTTKEDSSISNNINSNSTIQHRLKVPEKLRLAEKREDIMEDIEEEEDFSLAVAISPVEVINSEVDTREVVEEEDLMVMTEEASEEEEEEQVVEDFSLEVAFNEVQGALDFNNNGVTPLTLGERLKSNRRRSSSNRSSSKKHRNRGSNSKMITSAMIPQLRRFRKRAAIKVTNREVVVTTNNGATFNRGVLGSRGETVATIGNHGAAAEARGNREVVGIRGSRGAAGTRIGSRGATAGTRIGSHGVQVMLGIHGSRGVVFSSSREVLGNLEAEGISSRTKHMCREVVDIGAEAAVVTHHTMDLRHLLNIKRHQNWKLKRQQQHQSHMRDNRYRQYNCRRSINP